MFKNNFYKNWEPCQSIKLFSSYTEGAQCSPIKCCTLVAIILVVDSRKFISLNSYFYFILFYINDFYKKYLI